MLSGDAAAAEAKLRRELDLLEAMGETYLRPTVAAYLAAAVANQGRYDEADRFAALAAELASEDDVISQAMWRSVRARVLSREGRVEEAIELADGAVGLLAASDGIGEQADALLVLSEVLGGAGRKEDAGRAIQEAIDLYERKGNVVAAAAARVALAALDALDLPLPTTTPPS
jgi:tetratricopeptide (TPR) repeat protein